MLLRRLAVGLAVAAAVNDGGKLDTSTNLGALDRLRSDIQIDWYNVPDK